MKLGSLFDGSGTCPLAAILCGIEPVWASEIESYPIRVTRKNFPQMKHLGDVTQIKGDEIEPVDIITFGSPCQDLSVAGKRAGIHEGERSSLFFEAIRVIREMREKTHGRYPTFAVWENVPGAFSSNRGRDFLAVLQAFVEVAGGCNVPEPAVKQGKLQWSKDGCIMGDGFSIAWRMLDAQYWGVPQRRKRIYLVADFAGGRASEILFKREGLSGDSAESRTAWEKIAADATGSAGGSDSARRMNPRAVYALQGNGIDRAETAGCNGRGWREDVCYTLNTIDRPAICFKPGQGEKARTIGESEKTAPTLASEAGGNSVPGVCYPINEQIATRWNALGERTGLGIGKEDDPAFTLQAAHPHIVCYPSVFHTLTAQNARNPESAQTPNCVCYPRVARTLMAEADASPCVDRGQNVVCYGARSNGDGTCCPTLTGDHENRITDYTTICVMAHGQSNAEVMENRSPALNCNHEQPIAAYSVDCRNAMLDEKKTHTLQAKANGGQSLNCTPSVLLAGKPPRKYIIRRLTPLECCRLQGFPDWWEEGVEGSDTARYKMWGNGMALPCVLYVMQGIANIEKEEV